MKNETWDFEVIMKELAEIVIDGMGGNPAKYKLVVNREMKNWLRASVSRLKDYRKRNPQLHASIDVNPDYSERFDVAISSKSMEELGGAVSFFSQLCGWKHEENGLKAAERTKDFLLAVFNDSPNDDARKLRIRYTAAALGRWVNKTAP